MLDISNILILSSFYPIVKHQANILIEKGEYIDRKRFAGLYSSVLSAATISIFLFFLATIRPTNRETRNVSRMEIR